MHKELQAQLVSNLENAQQTVAAGDDLQALATALRQAHGKSVCAILYYGSCLRSGRADDGIADFYVVVDDYRKAGMGRMHALLNRLLPPNVYYLETGFQEKTLRAKYAVIRIDQFKKGVTGGWFLPYLWGRFAQPSGLLWVKDVNTANAIQEWLARALYHFIHETLSLLSTTFNAQALWHTGLKNSYQTELRAERDERITGLYAYWPDYYAQQTALVCEATDRVRIVIQQGRQGSAYQLADNDKQRRQGKRRWLWRKVTGKVTALAKLIKSLLTFNGALDYAAWKIERHSGQEVILPDYARRRPLIGGWIILWRLLRQGSLR